MHRPRLAILTHELDGFDASSYLVGQLARVWGDEGIDVTVVTGAEADPPPADVAVQHVDLTVVPEPYRRLAAAYPVVINGGVDDIRKSAISDLTLRPDETFDGPVIVKTEANAGGAREMRMARMTGALREAVRSGAAGSVGYMPQYMVYDSIADVPDPIWANPSLVVERFLPEPLGDGTWALRIWVFLGGREVHYRCISSAPVVKSTTTVRREFLDPATVPDEVRAARARLGFDYGKFDYTVPDGRPCLFDVNKTPAFPSAMDDNPRADALLRDLAGGVHSFLPAGRA